MQVGVDIGGTFTDILVTDDDGNLEVIKTPSTPANPDQGVINGLKEIETGLGRSVSDITFFSHATTVATNAVLEDEWAKTALVTTDGFRDVLEIGRQTRPELYDFQAEKPTPIVPRRRRYEVRERVAPSGDIETKLNKQGAREIAAEIALSLCAS
jgi:N-methylhydantoinase A